MTAVCTTPTPAASPKLGSGTRPAPIGPITCTSWCETASGHADEVFAADQYCTSVSGNVALSGEEPWEMSDGTTRPAEARVYACQDPEQPAHVQLANHNDQGMGLSPAEARDLARQLNHYAWVAEQG